MKDERRSRFFLTAGSIVVVVAVFSWEAVRAQAIYAGITPFPLGDYWELVINALLRDVVILALGGLLFFRRKRIPDRVRRYFPAVVLGAIYLGFAGFMIYKLALDPYFLTALALPAGLMNNIVPVLLAAFVYHHHPVTRNKVLYFAVYAVCAFLMLLDIIYFWQTTMHVQSVFFRNFNIYAIKGVMTSFSVTQIAGIIGFVAVVALLFRGTEPRRHKPNFVWGLMVVLGYTLLFNLLYFSGSQLGLFALRESGLWSDEQVEKSRQEYRDNLVTPIVPNIIGKALFKKEKVLRENVHKKKELTDKDKEWMYQLGVMRRTVPQPRIEPAMTALLC